MQLPLGDKDDVQELLDLGVAGLVIGQDLANKAHGMLHFEGVPFFFSLHHQGNIGRRVLHQANSLNLSNRCFFAFCVTIRFPHAHLH